jgi:hypothetical protein
VKPLKKRTAIYFQGLLRAAERLLMKAPSAMDGGLSDGQIVAAWAAPLLDPTPISVGFLMETGFRQYGGITFVFELDGRGRWMLELWQDDQNVALGPIATRSDLRRLLSVLRGAK